MSDMTARGQVAIVGVGYTRVVRHADRSLGSLAVEAAKDAIADAGLTRDQIDGYVGAPNAPNVSAAHIDGVDEVSAWFMAAALGLQEPRWVMDVGGMATGMVAAAAQALASGTCRYVVAVRAHYNPPDRRYSEASQESAAGPAQFTLPYGIGPAGGRFAQWLQRYMHDYGATRESLYEVVRIAREHAQQHTVAYWHGKGALTLDEYLASRWICEPMCLYDCDMPVTAAGAVVLTTAERARDLRRHPAYLAGYALVSERATAGRVYEAAGITPADVQVAQIYDGYSPLVFHWLEKLGFCGEGEAHQFVQGGRIVLGGSLPLNTFGGALGEGRLHGMGHLREAALQAMGRGGTRQVPGLSHSLVQVGIPERSWVLVLSAEP